MNNFTVVPIERLTDEELAFYLALARKGRAMPIDVKALPSASENEKAMRGFGASAGT